MKFPFFNRRSKVGSGRAQIRHFAAAEVSHILGPWKWDGGFSNQEVALALTAIRTRSRDMQKNSEHYARWLDLFVANVVGPDGFTLIPKPGTNATDPTVDQAAAKFIKYHFWKWATNPKYADRTGRKSFAAICRLVAENWARDGEGIVYIDRHTPTPYGISLRVIRPDALDEMMNGATGRGSIIRNGVEVDAATLAPIAYNFKAHEEDTGASYVGGKPVNRIPAADILHVFTQHDECQTRGVPLGHASLRKLKMLDEYNISELVAARDEANTVGIFHAPQDRENEIARLNEDSDASAYLCRKSEPDQKYVLPPGWDYESHTPQHPNRELVAFKNSMLRDVASGLGVEYANFANDWSGVSYSSVRVGTLAERDHWKVLQAQFVDQFATPVFLAWLESFLALSASGKYTAADFDRLSEHEFRGRRWEWVDPMKDINASVIAVQNGWKTNEQVTADYGGDYFDNLDDRATEKAKAEELGLAATGAAAPVEDPDDDTKDEA